MTPIYTIAMVAKMPMREIADLLNAAYVRAVSDEIAIQRFAHEEVLVADSLAQLAQMIRRRSEKRYLLLSAGQRRKSQHDAPR